MAFSTTAKHALRWLTGSSVISDIDAGFQALAEDVDGLMAVDDQGLEGSRPTSTPGTPGKEGRYYFATDTRRLFRDYGTGWEEIPIGVGQRWEAGDYKYSLQSANHGVLGGGLYSWLYADNAELGVGYTGLIALLTAAGNPFGIGPNGRPRLPDFRGRTPVALGTHPDVNALGDSDGEAVANRSPKHHHGTHGHSTYSIRSNDTANNQSRPTAGSANNSGVIGDSVDAAQVGPTGTPLHGPAHLVGGNWFVKS